jgi:phosphate butyryltransferase
MRCIADIISAAASSGKVRIAVAAAQDATVLEAASDAWKAGIADPILVGPRAAILKAARDANDGRGLDISAFELLEADDLSSSASMAVNLVRTGKAEILMKGLLDTSVLLRAAFNKETGIHAGRLASHVAVIESAHYHKLFLITDAAINIAPDLNAFVDIIASAVSVARTLGVDRPKVAVLAAVEKVNPDKMPCTVIAALLTQMNRRGQIRDCVIDGPLALDNAISAESARIKGIVSDVAGDADILVTPTVEAGNILYKSLLDLGGAKGTGIVMGAAKPIVLTSRSDSKETKLASIALASLVGRRHE